MNIALEQTVDAKRLKRLFDRKWIGERLERFWHDHGQDRQSLGKKPHLKNVHNWAMGNASPGFEALVSMAEACGTDLHRLIAYLDPVDDIESGLTIPAEHRPAVKMLLEVLAESDAQEAAIWLIGNIKTFHRAYARRRR